MYFYNLNLILLHYINYHNQVFCLNVEGCTKIRKKLTALTKYHESTYLTRGMQNFARKTNGTKYKKHTKRYNIIYVYMTW